MAGTGAWPLVKDTVSAFIEDEALSHGAAIAYYTMFAIAPVLLIITRHRGPGVRPGCGPIGHRRSAERPDG